MKPPTGLRGPGRAAWHDAHATLVALGEDPERSRGALILYARAVDAATAVRAEWEGLGRPGMAVGAGASPSPTLS